MKPDPKPTHGVIEPLRRIRTLGIHRSHERWSSNDLVDVLQ
jgi:hypothetical protein